MRLQQPIALWLWLLNTCLSAIEEGGSYMAAGLYSFGIVQSFVPFAAEVFFFFFFFFSCLSGIPGFGLLSHISSLRLSSGHSVQVLTLRANDTAHDSLPSSHSLLADTSICDTSLLVVAVRNIVFGVFFCLFVCFCCCCCIFFLPVMLPSEISKLPGYFSQKYFFFFFTFFLNLFLNFTKLY